MVSDGFVSTLGPGDFEALTAWGRGRRFRRGATLFNEGEDAGHVLIVRSGRVKISSYTFDGKEIVLAVRGPGELLGELSAIDGETRSATASAMEAVEVLAVPAEDFRAFLVTRPRVTVSLMQILSRKLRDADRKRIEFGAYDTVGRVCRRLVEMAERFGEQAGDGVRITLPLSQQELAGWTGSSREAVSKALQSLRGRGFIETARRGITVLDIEALRRRAI
jgi:CRP/FNR family transcriptional regulator, cyclic AMP receptor protein